jgi:hypothetical protein
MAISHNFNLCVTIEKVHSEIGRLLTFPGLKVLLKHYISGTYLNKKVVF